MKAFIGWAYQWLEYWLYVHWVERRLATEPCCEEQEADGKCVDCRATAEMQLGDDVKAMYPEQWQQDAILEAWRTGKITVGRPDHHA